MAGQAIGAIDAQKRELAVIGNYTEAKNKKVECEQFREKVYKDLMIADLLALPLPRSKPASAEGKELPPPTKLKSQRGSTRESIANELGGQEDEEPPIAPPPMAPVPPIAKSESKSSKNSIVESRKSSIVEKKSSILKKRSIADEVSNIKKKSVSDGQNEANLEKVIG